MKQHLNGKLLFLVVLVLSLYSCGTIPPKIEVCIGDGFGGADCKSSSGETVYKSPSQLKNYWMTNQNDMAAFSSWCYRTSEPKQIEVIEIEEQK